uniref:Putative DNA binding, helix-turn-helix domain containing protein n=1 Tax=viral metagenome TaxID=1070528 RepID=A0A6M3JWX2_9ZZZZ
MESIFEGLDQSRKMKVFLAAKNITQSDLATAMKCTPETISNRMKSGKWDITDLKKVAEYYGVDLTDLI